VTILLEVRNLVTDIGSARVVDGVSFQVARGETYALLGESGCGKSMTALSLMRLLPDGGRVTAGTVELGGENVLALPEREMRRVRGGQMAMIFQEPMLALNPVIKVGEQIGEALALHQNLSGQAARDAARGLLDVVGVPDAVRRLDSYPFELSGGLRQRAMIAMALAGQPGLLIADEPTTALDVTIQAQVLDVLRRLKTERQMGMLLITHDLAVVAENADRVGVMYAGELLEEGARDAFFAAPQHPYSRMLFEALPRPGDGGRLTTISGQVPRLDGPMRGCRFAPRCPFAIARCRDESPDWQEINGQRVRCHLAGQLPGQPPREVTDNTKADKAAESLLQVDGLKVYFPIRRGLIQRTVGHVRAVDDVSLNIRAGRTLALVGESGCGKTTVGKALLRLIDGGPHRAGWRNHYGEECKHPAAAGADGVPGPVQFAQSAHAGGRYPARGHGCTSGGRGRTAARCDGAITEPGGAARRCGRPLSACIFRWPAATYCHCAGARGVAPAGDLRRTDQCARCVGTSANPQSAEDLAGQPGAGLSFHHPQSRRG
jgi:peptide/nickel transport system ATP-binding protein